MRGLDRLESLLRLHRAGFEWPWLFERNDASHWLLFRKKQRNNGY